MKKLIHLFLLISIYSCTEAYDITYSSDKDFQTCLSTISNNDGGTLTILEPVALPHISPITVPANVELKFSENGSLTVHCGSCQLIINGLITANRHQIFYFAGDNGYSYTYVNPDQIKGCPKNQIIYPEWFGAVSDITFDNTNAIRSAISFINGTRKSCILDFSNCTYKINNTLNIDPSRLSIHGFASRLDFSSLPNGNTAIAFVNKEIEGQPQYYKSNIMDKVASGFTICGDTNKSITLFQFNCSHVKIENVNFYSAQKAVTFGNNAFLLTFEHCFFSGVTQCVWDMAKNTSNSGENISFDNCNFESADNVLISDRNESDFYFDNCSMDFNKNVITIIGSAQVFIDKCHIENSANQYPGGPYIQKDYQFYVNSTAPNLLISNSSIFIDKKGDWAQPLAYCYTGSGLGGIALSNTVLSIPGMYCSSYNGPLIDGDGKVTISNLHSYYRMFGFTDADNTSILKIPTYLCKSLNIISDGGFNTGAIKDFSLLNTQGVSIVNIDANPVCKLFQSSSNSRIGIKYTYPVKPGNLVLWGFRYRLQCVNLGNTFYNSFGIIQNILDKNGNVISNKESYNSGCTEWLWFHNGLKGVSGNFGGSDATLNMPAGACYIEIIVNLFDTGLNSTAYIDDFYLHVLE